MEIAKVQVVTVFDQWNAAMSEFVKMLQEYTTPRTIMTTVPAVAITQRFIVGGAD
jgi:hypothetical protein